MFVFAGFLTRAADAQVEQTLYWHDSEFNREWYEEDPSRYDSMDVTVNVVCDTDFNGPDEYHIVNAAGDLLYAFAANAFFQPPRPAGTVITFSVHGPSGPAATAQGSIPIALPPVGRELRLICQAL